MTVRLRWMSTGADTGPGGSSYADISPVVAVAGDSERPR